MFKSNVIPITAGQYRIVAPPKAAQQDQIPQTNNMVPLRPRKCARQGCTNPHIRNSLWCANDQHCGPETSCDNLPALLDQQPDEQE